MNESLSDITSHLKDLGMILASNGKPVYARWCREGNAEIERLRKERNQWQEKWTIAETEKVNQRNEAERLQTIVGKLPKCWRLNDKAELVQDVPIVLLGSYFYVCKIRGIRNVDVTGMDRLSKQKTSLNCVVWAFPPYLQGGRRLFPRELYDTRAAAEAAKGKS